MVVLVRRRRRILIPHHHLVSSGGGGGGVTTPVNRGTGSADDNNSIAVGAFTPSANALLIGTFGGATEASGPDLSVSGGSLTWTEHVDITSGAFGPAVGLWTAPTGGSPGSMTITLTAGSNFYSGGFSVDEVTGYNTSTPVSQTVSDSGSWRSGAYTDNFTSTTDADSVVMAVCYCGDVAANVDTDAAWVQIYEQSGGSSGTSNHQYFEGAVAGIHWDQIEDSGGGGWAAAGIEINAA